MTTLGTRDGFITRIAEHFGAAGIEYAFLHATEESDKDSDVDIVVNHRHLAAVEAVVRTGALGRIVQRMDYDVPWCRYYVLETGEPDRPFRQLDVASDPYGISRYGLGLTQALSRAHRVNGIPVLRPPALVVYLATKRARKGIASISEGNRLKEAYGDDPAGAEELLVGIWGPAGAAVARALAGESDLEGALFVLARVVARSRRTARRMVLRGGFEARRYLDRLRRPTGLVVQVAGPDGSGKSTMAETLADRLRGAFRGYERLHVGPGLLPPPARLLGRASSDPTTPQGRIPNGWVGSHVRIAYLAADTLLGWTPRVWLPRVRSGLVVLERGWDDLQVDPIRYRLGAGESVVRMLSRLLPRPDLTIVLTGNPRRIAERKPELAEVEIERQIASWRAILAARRRGCEVDTTESSADENAGTAIVEQLSQRAGDLAGLRAVLDCMGSPAAAGRRYSVVNARGRPRWLLPRRPGAPGPRGAALYRPASAKHELGALLLGVAQRVGGLGFDTVSLDACTGLAPEIEAKLGIRNVELACLLPTDPARSARAAFAVLCNGRPIAIAKVALAGSTELARERDVLTTFACVETGPLMVPKPLASFSWRHHDVLVISLVPRRGGTDRALASPEKRTLVAIARLTPHLEQALGPAAIGEVLVHGDFSAWNSARHGRQQVALWDWEWARYGLPLEDYFHWQTQRVVHFGRGSVTDLVASALTPNPDVVRMWNECSFETCRAPEALVASLHAGIATAPEKSPGAELRRDALRLLVGSA